GNADGIFNNISPNSPITNSGMIHTGGNSSFGIYNDRSDDSPVNNSGSIHTEGDNADGIINDESDNAPVTNSGSIRTEGENAVGIFNVGTVNSPVTNSGTIHTEGDFADGIYNLFSSNSPITNSGAIYTDGFESWGIWNESNINSPVTNSGTIHTRGDDSFGILNDFSDDSPVTNIGTIRTEGEESHGIWNDGTINSPVSNSGMVHTRGINAIGILNTACDCSPITNSGYVVSERSFSIVMDSFGGVLNLQAPGYLGGEILFASPAFVNLQTGKSHSVLWDLSSGPMFGGDPSSISGPVPWFYNSATKQFATYDPSGLAGSVNQLGDMTNLLSQVGRSGLRRNRYSAATSYAPDAGLLSSYSDNRLSSAFGIDGGTFGADLDPAYISPTAPGQFWISGFGGSIDHDGDSTTLDQTIDQYGFAAGYSWQHSANLQFNLMGGYIKGNIEADSRYAQSQDIDTDGWFAGIYGEQQFSGVNIDFGIVGGWLSSDSSRFVNDNLALTNGLTLGRGSANASYHSWFLAPEAGIGLDISSGDIVYTPSARIRYAMQEIDGYTESGSAANATVGSRSIGMVEANVEMAAAKQVNFGTLTGRLGYLFRHSTGDDAVSVAMLGISNPIGFGDTDSKSAYLGLEADIAISSTTSLVLDGAGFFGSDMQGYQGMAKLVASF
ncbi:MAG: autotransporter outer membrane beta-barrel domain-containing protein, partial [Rhizobiaceae bacterium]